MHPRKGSYGAHVAACSSLPLQASPRIPPNFPFELQENEEKSSHHLAEKSSEQSQASCSYPIPTNPTIGIIHLLKMESHCDLATRYWILVEPESAHFKPPKAVYRKLRSPQLYSDSDATMIHLDPKQSK